MCFSKNKVKGVFKKKLFGKKREFRDLGTNSRVVFKQNVFPLYGGALISKTPLWNFIAKKNVDGILILEPFYILLNFKKAIYILFSIFKRDGNVLLATNELVIRRYLKQYTSGLPYLKKNVQCSVKRWAPGALSNYKNVRHFIIPDIVVALAADFDELILVESNVVLRPSISLIEGRVSVLFADYPIFFSGALISPGKVLIKIIIDLYFMSLKDEFAYSF